ncbi:hypothetical protein F4780DRAFT_793875 [Xylariomycetidae sp. FL0641]|nr:hypothetical protein F4780DRAFT_793875 [Xylariomycetidae sp. FL0641]
MAITPATGGMSRDQQSRWNHGMEMPEEVPLPPHSEGLLKDISPNGPNNPAFVGSAGREDPLIVWLGAIPADYDSARDAFVIDRAKKEANEAIARMAAQSLQCPVVYIRSAAHATKLVYGDDNMRIPVRDRAGRFVRWATMPADPHLTVIFGQRLGHANLQGHVNVRLDGARNPAGFAFARDPRFVVNGDDRVLEYFRFADSVLCAGYCAVHGAADGVLLRDCPHARSAPCVHHHHAAATTSRDSVDHYCPRPNLAAVGAQLTLCVACGADVGGLADHWCRPGPALDHWCAHCTHDDDDEVAPGDDHWCRRCPHRGVEWLL